MAHNNGMDRSRCWASSGTDGHRTTSGCLTFCAMKLLWRECTGAHELHRKRRRLTMSFGCPLEGDQVESSTSTVPTVPPANESTMESFVQASSRSPYLKAIFG